MKKSFVLYHDQYDAIEDLTSEQKGQLLDAMFLYSRGESVPDLDQVVRMAFKFFKIVLDRDNDKWVARSERNKKNGKKGGRPKSNDNEDLDDNPSEPKEPSGLSGLHNNPSEPKKAVSVSESVSVSVSVSDNDINNTPLTPQGENPKKKTVKRFVPPTVDEVTCFCKERGNSVDPESFVNNYESKGWMVGKNKMKSWQAAVRTWEKNSYGNQKKPARKEFDKEYYGETDTGRPNDMF